MRYIYFEKQDINDTGSIIVNENILKFAPKYINHNGFYSQNHYIRTMYRKCITDQFWIDLEQYNWERHGNYPDHNDVKEVINLLTQKLINYE